MANRLQLFLLEIINSNQVAFVKGREATDNTIKLVNLKA